MPQTIAEKLFSRHDLAGGSVRAGDMLEARIDGAMVHYHANEPMLDLAREAGFKDGLPRVWDRERVFVLVDHHQPTLSQKQADENALIRMLEADEIAGAGLDVFEQEPVVSEKLVALAKSGKVTLLPHMGSATHEGRTDMGEKVIVNIKTFADGHKPPDRVIPAML